MLEPNDLKAINELIAQPLKQFLDNSLKEQEKLIDEKMKSIGRSLDSIRTNNEEQTKQYQKTTRELLDFKAGQTVKVQAIEDERKKTDRRIWVIILSIITLGISKIVEKLW